MQDSGESFRDRLEKAKADRVHVDFVDIELTPISDGLFVRISPLSIDDYSLYGSLMRNESYSEWALIIASCKDRDNNRAFDVSDIPYLESVGGGLRHLLMVPALELSGSGDDSFTIAKAKLVEDPFYDFCFDLMHGPYQGKSLSEVRALPMSELLEWKLRYDRCPWGPKIDHLKHAQLCMLNGYKGMKIENYQFDKTHEIAKKLKWDIEGKEELDSDHREEEAIKQADFLSNMKAKYGSTKRK